MIKESDTSITLVYKLMMREEIIRDMRRWTKACGDQRPQRVVVQMRCVFTGASRQPVVEVQSALLDLQKIVHQDTNKVKIENKEFLEVGPLNPTIRGSYIIYCKCGTENHLFLLSSFMRCFL